MADIFKEVDEDLRRDNLEKLWKKYGFQFMGLAAAVVLGVAGVQGWQAYDLDQRSKLSDRYGAAHELAQSGETAAGLDAMIDLSEASGDSYAGLAAFEEARLRVESGDTGGAIAVWDRIAEGSGLGPGFKEAATLFSILHQIDSGDPAALRARLEPLAADSQPFRSSARELLALIALGAGDMAVARDLYTKISDDREAPAGLRQRATQMLAALKE
ncbi:MAG: tetratricopeptide repeat protein [Kiloniellales bacterium]